ncbi:hypothetical protein L209DRAFT_152600 [Thermothelomyces heterothallicus CBS 203.75]
MDRQHSTESYCTVVRLATCAWQDWSRRKGGQCFSANCFLFSSLLFFLSFFSPVFFFPSFLLFDSLITFYLFFLVDEYNKHVPSVLNIYSLLSLPSRRNSSIHNYPSI